MSPTSGVDLLHGLRLWCETPRITPMISADRARPGATPAVCAGKLCRSPVVERLFRVRSR